MKPNQITAALMGTIFIFLVSYDIFALTFWGVDSTISVVINQWAFRTHPLMTFMAGFIVGGLVIHLLKWAPKDEQTR